MAAYDLMHALAGFSYSAPEQTMRFEPRIRPERFRCFYSVGSGWGVFSRRVKRGKREVAVRSLYGELTLARLQAPVGGKVRKARADLSGQTVPTRISSSKGLVTVVFDSPVLIREGERLRVRFS